MPIQPTYPGVYVEEIPSGVRTLTGVATSITAFLGTAPRGPVNQSRFITSFGDYIRAFGGLDVNSMMSYAVRDFFQNGGGQAVIVRVVNDATAATITLPGSSGDLTLEASSPGAWGNNLRATVTYRSDVASTTLFNLTVEEVQTELDETKPVKTETFLNVSSDPDDPRFITRVLASESTLVRVNGNVTGRPDPTFSSIASIPGTPDPIESNGDGTDDTTPPGVVEYIGDENAKTGMRALDSTDLFNLLCIPPATRDGVTDSSIYVAAAAYCVQRRAMLIVDPPATIPPDTAADTLINAQAALGITGTAARNAAFFVPRVRMKDPLRDNQLSTFVPCGIIAGVMARIDGQRGVWKAPAGVDATLNGVTDLQVKLTDAENGRLNPLGINCLRSFPVFGNVVWGSRTLRGADQVADEYKYIPVRRLALFLEESIYRGTQWVVFEPNDEPLWAQIRLNVGSFMQGLFRQGAFQGKTPRDAYLVKCDRETTTQADINAGVVNVLIGFAPLKPAEFVLLKIQQLAGQIVT